VNSPRREPAKPHSLEPAKDQESGAGLLRRTPWSPFIHFTLDALTLKALTVRLTLSSRSRSQDSRPVSAPRIKQNTGRQIIAYIVWWVAQSSGRWGTHGDVVLVEHDVVGERLVVHELHHLALGDGDLGGLQDTSGGGRKQSCQHRTDVEVGRSGAKHAGCRMRPQP
jgi:hypothetical protein